MPYGSISSFSDATLYDLKSYVPIFNGSSNYINMGKSDLIVAINNSTTVGTTLFSVKLASD